MTGDVGLPDDSDRVLRTGMQILGSGIPVLGGLLSAGASIWSEREQDAVNKFFRAQMKMLEDELREKHRVLGEVIARLDVHDEEIQKRIRSEEYQTLLKKALRNWAGTESRKKQEYVRNLLANAAATRIVTDDVVMLFLDWLQKYSEFHFTVVGDIYRNPGATRAATWERLGKGPVREDSAEADLFKLLVRELSVGGVIRQHRETDYQGNFIPKRAPAKRGPASKTMASAFDDEDQYELTALGKQFVHYVMTELTLKISYQPQSEEPANEQERKDNVHVV